jgi:hypothetical protein
VTLEQVLTDLRGDAARLRYHGHRAQADSMEALADRVATVMQPYLDWLTEAEARARSGRSEHWLRARFGEWAQAGLAEFRGRRRYYRRLIVPRRANLEAVRADAVRAARSAA